MKSAVKLGVNSAGLDMASLAYRSEEVVEIPQGVELHNDVLWWRTLSRDSVLLSKTVQLPTENCLNDLLELDGGTAADVLAFVERRGLLGIVPGVSSKEFVSETGPLAGCIEYTCREHTYFERVAVYVELARQARAIISLMQSIRRNKPVKRGDVSQCFSPWIQEKGNWDEALPALLSPQQAYWELTPAFLCWGQAATFSLKIGFRNETYNGPWIEGVSKAVLPHFVVRFGKWQDGFDWDYKQPPIPQGSQIGVNEPSEEEQMVQSDGLIVPCGISQRPSPLFNVLAFQLMKEITLEKGSAWCDVCKCLYIYSREEAENPASKNYGMTPPKPDMDTGGCCCEKHAKRKEYQGKYQRRKARGCYDKPNQNTAAD